MVTWVAGAKYEELGTKIVLLLRASIFALRANVTPWKGGTFYGL